MLQDPLAKSSPPSSDSQSAILVVVLVYAVFASLWILLSDKLIQLNFSEPDQIILVSIFKGWLFVGVTSLLLYTLMRRWVGTKPLVRTTTVNFRRLGVPFILLTIFIIGLTSAGIINAFIHHKQIEIARLNAIADLKSLQISDWLRERQADADFLQSSELFVSRLRVWQVSADKHQAEQLWTQIEPLLKNRSVAAITLMDLPGKQQWHSANAPTTLSPNLLAAVTEAAVSRKMQHVGPYRDEADNYRLDLIIPLLVTTDHPLSAVLHVDLAEWFWPLLHLWPVPTVSGESIIVRRDGDQLSYLSDLRHTSAVQSTSEPIEATLAEQLLRTDVTKGKAIEGLDYEGVSVIAVVWPIPNTDWMLLVKLDKSELFNKVSGDIAWIGFTGLLTLLLTAVGFNLLSQSQQLALSKAVEKAQEANLRDLTLLRAVADGSDDAIFAKDLEGRYILFNRAASRFVGKPAEDVVGHDDRAIFPLEQAEKLMAIGRQVIAEHRIQSKEEVLTTVDGDRIFYATKGPLQTPDGKVIGLFGIARDITELKQVEHVLRANEEFKRAVLDSINSHIVVINSNADIIEVNLPWRRFAEENGLRGTELAEHACVGVNYLKICQNVSGADSEEAILMYDGIKDVLAGRLPSFTLEYPCHGFNEERWFTATVTPLGDASNGAVIAHTDISQRKKAQAELQLWARPFEFANFGLSVIDAVNNTFLAVNPTYAREHGYSQEELIGQPVIIVYPPDLVDEFRSKISELDKASHCTFETEHIAKDGRRFPVLVDITLIKSADGKPLSRVTYVQDISKRKQSERELKESEHRFRQLFALIPIPMAINTQDGNIVALNDRFVDTFGYTQTECPTVTEWSLLAYPDPNYRSQVMNTWNDALQRALSQKTDIEPQEYQVVSKDGQVRTVIFSGIILVDSVLVILSDITERRVFEDALRSRERYQRALLDNFPFMVWLKDTESRLLAANQAYAHVANVLDPDEVIGKTDLDFWDAELAEQYRADDRAVLESGQPKSVEEEITQAGRRFWIETYKSPVILDGKIIGTVGFARDISARKMAQNEILRRNEEIERFNRAMIGRELDMIALKQRINELYQQLGLLPPYPLSFLGESAQPPEGAAE